MKKIILCALVLNIALSSCRKNWVCTCQVDTTTEEKPSNIKRHYSSVELKVIKKSSKANARPNCLTSSTNYSLSTYEGSEAVERYYSINENCVLE